MTTVKHVLKIRKSDSLFFDLIKSGRKTVETRAGTDQYKKIKVGDVLVFICGKRKIEKKVIEVDIFATIDDLLLKFDLKKIMPHVFSVKEAKEVWFSFPDYKEKIKKHGLVAFELNGKQ